MARSSESKKPVLVRLKQATYAHLIQVAAKESVKRGVTVSVPLLISEHEDRVAAEASEKQGSSSD